MPRARPDVYHLPRLPLIKSSVRCAGLGILGLLHLGVRGLEPWNFAGLIPLGYALGRWYFYLRPKWDYAVSLGGETLRFKKRDYRWDDLQSLRVEQFGSHKQLSLSYRIKGKPVEVIIKDTVVDFDHFAQQCFYRTMFKPAARPANPPANQPDNTN